MRPELPSGHRTEERGSAFVVALLVVLLVSLLSIALLGSSDLDRGVSANGQFAEGAFFAAEAAVQVGIDQVGADPVPSITAIPSTAIGGVYTFRSGSRGASGPQALVFNGTTDSPGFSLDAGTGYNTAGFVYNRYRINGTGDGPRNAQREVEVQVSFGPVPR
jgi:Tfp pilus assembly protein PilX